MRRVFSGLDSFARQIIFNNNPIETGKMFPLFLYPSSVSEQQKQKKSGKKRPWNIMPSLPMRWMNAKSYPIAFNDLARRAKSAAGIFLSFLFLTMEFS